LNEQRMTFEFLAAIVPFEQSKFFQAINLTLPTPLHILINTMESCSKI